MPGFALPMWAVLLVAGLGAIGLIVTIVVLQVRAAHLAEQWKPLSRLLIPGAQYLSDGPIDSQVLAEAVDRAFFCLAVYGPWTREQLQSVLANIRIHVTATEGVDCHCGTHEQVGGVALVEVRVVVVGASLRSLVHEFAHVAEFWLEGTVDYQHANWGSKGITLAEKCYRGE